MILICRPGSEGALFFSLQQVKTVNIQGCGRHIYCRILAVGDVAELDGGFGGPETKSHGVGVVELHFYFSTGNFLLRIDAAFVAGKLFFEISVKPCIFLFFILKRVARSSRGQNLNHDLLQSRSKSRRGLNNS